MMIHLDGELLDFCCVMRAGSGIGFFVSDFHAGHVEVEFISLR